MIEYMLNRVYQTICPQVDFSVTLRADNSMKFEAAHALDDSTGNALVEFTLVLPVFVLVMFGVIQFGLLFTARVALESSVAEAGRFAATNPPPLASRVSSFAMGVVSSRLDLSRLDPPVVTDNVIVNGMGGARTVELTYHYPNYFKGVLPGISNNFTIRTFSTNR